MILQPSLVRKSLLYLCKANVGFLTELCCDTIVHLLFQHFLLLKSLLHFLLK